MKLLNYLSMDFPNLRRFILAAQQMERLTKSELAKKDAEVQAKVYNDLSKIMSLSLNLCLNFVLSNPSIKLTVLTFTSFQI